MQLWSNRASEVSIREQLVTQVILGILSGDLAPGQRLPSTRELARRFKLHPNTASAGYRQLEREGWLESRRGSGVFVRPGVRTGARTEKDKAGARPSSDHSLDQLVSDLFTSARTLGIPLTSVRTRLREKLKQPPPDHFLLIEPDDDLRKIVAAEIQRAVDFPVKSAGLDACKSSKALKGGIPVVLQSKAKIAAEALPPGTDLITLQTRRCRNRWPDGFRLRRIPWSRWRPVGRAF
jgi:DNA-binding transcriptional regulator YhcF (GntR family)